MLVKSVTSQVQLCNMTCSLSFLLLYVPFLSCLMQTCLGIVLISCLFITDNKPIPTNLQKEAISIHGTLDWDDEGGDGMCNIYCYCANVTCLLIDSAFSCISL